MSEIKVEIVFALAQKQSLQTVLVDAGASVADVIEKSELASAFADQNLAEMACGIWGREVARHHAVKDGDRIELYRPLELDPREARRQLALSGRTMSSPESD